MNERIKELTKQSGLDVYGLGLDRVKWESAIEKFAELIIQECAKIARATPCPYDDTTPMLPQLGHTWDMACLESGRQIIQHFGVK